MKLVLTSLIFWIGTGAHAGVGAHGGNVVSCPGKPVVTLDYFNATLPTVAGPAKTVDVSAMSEDQAFQFIRARFANSLFLGTFDYYATSLGPISGWIAADLKSIDDSQEPYALPPGCSRETAAVRQGAAMYADPSVLTRMSPAQIGLLRAHEVLYKISKQDSSAMIRDLFRVLLAQEPDYGLLYNLLRAMQVRVAGWEYLDLSHYTTAKGSAVQLPGHIYEDPTVPFQSFDYIEVLKGNVGSTHTGQYRIACDVKSYSCTVVEVVHRSGSAPNLKDCTITWPTDTEMKMQCPAYRGPLVFKRI